MMTKFSSLIAAAIATGALWSASAQAKLAFLNLNIYAIPVAYTVAEFSGANLTLHGNLNKSAYTFSGLSATGTVNGFGVLGITYGYQVDNTVYTAGPLFDNSGIGIVSDQMVNGSNVVYKFYTDPSTIPGIYQETDTASSGVKRDIFAVSSVGGVPEPATWALFVVGFGFVGNTMRRSRRFADRFATT